MAEYKISQLPPKYAYVSNGLCKWFEEESDNGWELVCPNSTRVINGNTKQDYQSYIFKRKVDNKDLI